MKLSGAAVCLAAVGLLGCKDEPGSYETKGSDQTKGAEFTLFAKQRSQVPVEGEDAAGQQVASK